MSNYIADEKSIFAYRKLIDLVGSNPISFFINFGSEQKIYDLMRIYDSSFIELLFLICNFLFADIEDDYLAVKITATKVIHPYDGDRTLKGGFSNFTDYYVTEKYKEDAFYSHFDDKLAKIIEDFPEISKTQESTNTLLFVRLVNLLYGIYTLDPSISSTFFYESGIGITITKGAKFNMILKDGAFIRNLQIPVKSFNRSLFGVHGNNLISFNKQLEVVRNTIKQRFEQFDVSDVVIIPQAQPFSRWPKGTGRGLEYDDRIRLLDCLFYLEYKGEIKFIELLPNRFVIDASRLSIGSNERYEEISINPLLKLVPEGSAINIVAKDTDEKLYSFINKSKENERLKLFLAIAEKYPDYATRDEIANKLGKVQGRLNSGDFYKSYIYNPVKTLNTILKIKTKDRLYFDTSDSSEKGYLLKIDLK